jgi:antitoxin component of RelBE/YafQ-DinJ toxin-antitoxin module
MRIIQNEMVAFRCPNTLKERLNEIALNSDMHVSQVVRMACAELVFRRSQTGTKD